MIEPPHNSGLITWMQAFFGGGLTTLIVAGLGRLVWHSQEANAGRRPWIGKHLFVEIPTAVAMAVVAESGAAWVGFPSSVTTGMVAVVSYMGPRGLRDIFDRWFYTKKA